MQSSKRNAQTIKKATAAKKNSAIISCCFETQNLGNDHTKPTTIIKHLREVPSRIYVDVSTNIH